MTFRKKTLGTEDQGLPTALWEQDSFNKVLPSVRALYGVVIFPLPGFPGWSLEIRPSSSVGDGLLWTLAEAFRRSSSVLEISDKASGRVFRVLWSEAVGWTPLSRPGLSSWSLAGPLCAESRSALPDGMEEAVLDIVPSRDDLVALEVVES